MAVDIAVLGAGPAGLGAAWWAARKGATVRVLERATVPGGATGSFEVGGVRVDHGSHRLHPTTDPLILDQLRGLLGDGLQERTRNGRIRLGGRWIGFPLRAGDLIRHLPPSFAAAAAFDAVTGSLRRPRSDTFDEVIRASLGPTMWRRFYGPYARKIWGVDPSLLAGEQARRRVSAGSPGKLLRRVLARQAQAPPSFYYPRRGFGAIAEELARAAADAGADIRYSAAVTRLQWDPGGALVHTGNAEPFRAQRVWSTLPVTVLAGLCDPAPGPAVEAAAGALRFRSMVLVYLVLDTDRWTPFDAHYLPEETTPVTRVSEPKNYRDGDDPHGRTVLCAEIPCSTDDAVWSLDEEALGRLVSTGLAAQGLPPVKPVEVVVRRLSHAYPIYDVGYAGHFAVLDEWGAAQPRLLTFGRQGLFAHDNTHHALAMAWAAVAAWQPGGGFDEASWTAARLRFTEHVVED